MCEVKVLIYCPSWEKLYEKCVKLCTLLQSYEYVNVKFQEGVSVSDLKYLKIQDGLIQLPQIVVICRDEARVFTRQELEEKTVEQLLQEVLYRVRSCL